jgi:hypothetical protein
LAHDDAVVDVASVIGRRERTKPGIKRGVNACDFGGTKIYSNVPCFPAQKSAHPPKVFLAKHQDHVVESIVRGLAANVDGRFINQ